MLYFQTQNVLVPRQVYIGDRAELRCTFTSDGETMSSFETSSLPLEAFCSDLDFTSCEILGVQLQRFGTDNYTLTVTFIPWRTGPLQLPDYDLGKASGGAEDVLGIQFEPVEIISLVKRDSISAMQEMEAPLLLPGTVYGLYAFTALAIILLILIVNLIVKHKKVAVWFKNLQQKIRFKKNKKEAQRELELLLKDDAVSAHDFASKLQGILRKYLEVRFDFPFTKAVSSELENKLYAAAEKIKMPVTDNKSSAFGELVKIFKRTDFLRYSRNADYNQNEKTELIKNCCNQIEAIELIEQVVEEDNA